MPLNNEFPLGGFVWEKYAKRDGSFVDVLLERRQDLEPGKTFWYSDVSAHLVAAVLAAALERADGNSTRRAWRSEPSRARGPRL